MSRAIGPAVATVVAVNFFARVLLVEAFPVPFAFDGFQRWMGRDWVLVQDWLPLTQLLIWAAAQVGGLEFTRLVMAAVGALAAGAGAWAAAGIAKKAEAAWWFLPFSLLGGFVAWTTVFYQEGTFLAVFYLGLALALSGRLGLADLAFGLLGLVRYEGWPILLFYLAWRREPRALLALWGAAVWVGIRLAEIEPFRGGPADFQDWKGLVERFSWSRQVDENLAMLEWTFTHGCVVPIGVALLNLRERVTRALVLLFLVQVAITEAWIAGLETATSRMLLVPTMLLAPAAAAYAAGVPEHWRRWAGIGLGAFVLGQANAAWERCEYETRVNHAEVELLAAVEACEDCVWWIDPRPRLGTRARHSGCEVIAGISELRFGVDAFCAGWQDAGAARQAFARCTSTARWDGTGYRVDQHGPNSSRYGPPPSLAPSAAGLGELDLDRR